MTYKSIVTMFDKCGHMEKHQNCSRVEISGKQVEDQH